MLSRATIASKRLRTDALMQYATPIGSMALPAPIPRLQPWGNSTQPFQGWAVASGVSLCLRSNAEQIGGVAQRAEGVLSITAEQ